MKLTRKIKRKLTKLRLQPIRVFCLHHVSEEFEPSHMQICDWTDVDIFKQKILNLKKNGTIFISLQQAYNHIIHDFFRTKKYAVVTFDDGYKDILEVLPWLEENQIPSTLFINGKYLDGKSYRENPNEEYISRNELFSLNSYFVEIANHGWEHVSSGSLTDKEFLESVLKNKELLSTHPRYVSFWAYTYGNHREATDTLLKKNALVPVLIDGSKNYNDSKFINRELIINHE